MNRKVENSEYLRELFDATFEGIFIYKDGVIMDINRAAAVCFGYDRSELVGHNVLDVIEKNSRKDIIEKIAAASKDPDLKLGPYETVALKKDGSTFIAEVFSKKISIKDETARVVAFRDITEKKKAENEIIEKEKIVRSLFYSTFEGLFVVENYKIVFANPSASQISGYAYEELLGKNPSDLLTEESSEKLMEFGKSLVQHPEQKFGPIEATAIKKDGSLLDIEIRGKTVIIKEEQTRFISFRNITDRKRSERSLREREKRFRKYNLVLVSLANSEILYCEDLKKVAESITEAAANTLKAGSASIWFFEESDFDIKCGEQCGVNCLDVYSRDDNEHFIIIENHAEGMDLFQYYDMLKVDRTIAVNDLYTDTRTKDMAEKYWRQYDIHATIDSPIRKGGEILGVLNVCQHGQPRRWHSDEQNFVASLADLLAMAHEACQRKRAEEAIEKLLKLEDLLNEISGNFISNPMEEADFRMNEALERIGHFFKADRTYLFQYIGEKDAYDNTHEWCAEGIKPLIDTLKNIPIPALSWTTKEFAEKDLLKISKLSELPPEAIEEREMFEDQDIKSLILIPMKKNDILFGLWGMDMIREERAWPNDNDQVMIAIGRLFTNILEHKTDHEALQLSKVDLEQKVDARTKQLKEKHMQLVQSEKMASLGQLVAGVAHEINTPLGALKSNNDVFIRSAKKMREELQKLEIDKTIIENSKIPGLFNGIENLNDINKDAAQRITKIVHSLRNFARLDQAEKDTVDIHEGIESTLTLVHHEIKGRINIHKDFENLPNIDCFPNQINQVFMNILVNASQAIEGKGDIHIRTSVKDAFAVIEISDTGKGIPGESIKKIFDPGFTTKGAGVGTGLGLSIVYQIIKDHKGDIEVESEAGKGSLFRVLLPVKDI